MKKLKPNTYVILSECIAEGIKMGRKRAFKHTNDPSMEYLEEQLLYNIMVQISEKFKFDD